MNSIANQAYIISDLHLGGRFPTKAGDRGFRMMDRPDALALFIQALAKRPSMPFTELVINGDFIDFLSEETDENEWKAFREEPGEAELTFRRLADRKEDGEVFDALASFLDAGHRLTILVGNHDTELTWPEVRGALEERLWKSPKKKNASFNLRWFCDGEALVIGDALIEHGNRYDPANFVDHENLRHVRELRSRRLYSREKGIFYPPVGSRLVAEIMNPVKKDYPFIDLLKPESEPLFGLLLALDPSRSELLDELAAILVKMPLNASGPAADPGYRQKIAGGAMATTISRRAIAGAAMNGADEGDSAIAQLFSRAIPAARADEAQKAVELIAQDTEQVSRKQIASKRDHLSAWWSLIRLVTASKHGEIEKRIPLLRHAIRALRGDKTFDETIETGQRYLRAAQQLASGEQGLGHGTKTGFRFVIFGHTHHFKKVDLVEQGATYLNSGTWARLMRFPDKLVSNDDQVVEEALREFVKSIQEGTYTSDFVPTYVRLMVKDDGHVENADVIEFDPQKGTVE